MENDNLKPASVPVPSGPGPVPPGAGVPPAEKRGPGRPRGPRKPLGLSQPPAAGGAPSPALESSGNIVAPLWTGENCRPIGQLPFLVAGVATGYEGWNLEEKEAAAIGDALAPVLNAFIPSGGKYAAVVALSSTLLVISGMKYKHYREHLAAQAAKAKQEGERK